MLSNLFMAEWLKLRRRPMAWALLAIFLGLLLLAQGLWALVLALHLGAIGGVQLDALAPAQLEQIKLQLSFPGVFGAVLGQVNGSGGILAIILAAGALGSDYSWGTMRTLLARAPARGTYLLAKTLALLLGLLLAILIALAIGALLALVTSAWLGLPGQLSGRDLLALPVGIARALLVILPYLLATLACAAWGRSVLAGVGGGLIFLALDVGAGSLSSLGLVNELVRFMLNLLLQPNINTLVVLNGQLFGLDQAVLASALDLASLPSPLQATLVVLLYCAGFAYTAWRSLARRDVTGAA
jgi:ABC-2 type transport system permease protein